tara:strand:- start:20 stop:538 length:519 start_codon:yes stop_codon:yes gene_type:complete
MRQHKYELSAPLRVQLQLRRWRRDPIFGIIENKLLQATLLSSIENARQAPVVYGAFATKAMGAWPRWSRTSLERALEGKRHFVLKSATNGGGADVLIMTEERWRHEGWRVENVSRYAGRWMEKGAPRSPIPEHFTPPAFDACLACLWCGQARRVVSATGGIRSGASSMNTVA